MAELSWRPIVAVMAVWACFCMVQACLQAASVTVVPSALVTSLILSLVLLAAMDRGATATDVSDLRVHADKHRSTRLHALAPSLALLLLSDRWASLSCDPSLNHLIDWLTLGLLLIGTVVSHLAPALHRDGFQWLAAVSPAVAGVGVAADALATLLVLATKGTCASQESEPAFTRLALPLLVAVARIIFACVAHAVLRSRPQHDAPTLLNRVVAWVTAFIAVAAMSQLPRAPQALAATPASEVGTVAFSVAAVAALATTMLCLRRPPGLLLGIRLTAAGATAAGLSAVVHANGSGVNGLASGLALALAALAVTAYHHVTRTPTVTRILHKIGELWSGWCSARSRPWRSQ